MLDPENEPGPEKPASMPDAAAATLLRVLAAASPLVIFLALPPFHNGIWVQVEGAVPWLHLLSAAAAASIAWLAARGDAEILATLRHPLFLIPVLTAVLSLLLLPWTRLWGLSILGSPEHGFGALAFLDTAVLTAAMMSAWNRPRWRRAIVVSVTATTAGAFILDGLFRGDRSWAPFFFADYLAFYAIYFFVVVSAWMPGREFALARTRTIALALLFAGLIILSGNKAALLSGGIALVALLAAWKLGNDWRLWLAAALFPVLVGAATVLIGPLWEEHFRRTLPAEIGIGPLAELIISSWPSLWSRAMLIIVGAQSLIDEPSRFAVGMGWGHYSEALLTNLTIVEGRLQEFIGQSRAYWDAIRRSDFHSHNNYLESLLSLGFAGLLLAIYYMAAMLRSARGDRLRLAVFFVLFLGTLQSFWFQMPHALPVMAAAMAAIAAAPGDRSRARGSAPPKGVYGAALASVIAAALLAGSIASNMAANTARTALNFNQSAGMPVAKIQFGGGTTFGLSEIYRAALLQNAFAKLAAEMAANGKAAARSAERLKILLEPVLGQDRDIKSAALTVTVVNVLAGLLFRFPDLARAVPNSREGFLHHTETMLARLPRRSDLAIPYFNLLIRDGQEARALATAERILSNNPVDAVALWFSGIVLLAGPKKADQGLARMRRALDFGIRNRIPIAKPLLRQLMP